LFSGRNITCAHYFYIIWRCTAIAITELMINEEIRDPQVRLIGENGDQLGIVDVRDAQKMADDRELDLVKISPTSNPPVCKLMDYGKYRFEMSKREKEQRKNQKIIELKETRLSATIDVRDMEIKAKQTVKFLADGDKVKVSIRFRGRQITHGEIGMDVMVRFFEMLGDSAIKEREPKMEGRSLFMILAPKAEKKQPN
jgi:translation initiation factor IF-3